jgi:hypothetical protein
MSDNKNNGGMMQVCGLWKNKDREGRTFLSGNLNSSVGILIFLNGYKNDDKQPDYMMKYVQREQQDKKPDATNGDDLDQSAGGMTPDQSAAQRGSTVPPTHNSNGTPVCAEDDIPFDQPRT